MGGGLGLPGTPLFTQLPGWGGQFFFTCRECGIDTLPVCQLSTLGGFRDQNACLLLTFRRVRC